MRIYRVAIEQTERKTSKRQINLFDAGFIVVILLAIAGLGLASKGHAGVDKQITESGVIAVDIFFVGIKTLDVNLFKVGDPSALTIRNQPVTPPMKITKALHWAKQVAFLSPDGKKALSMNDPANPIAYDFLVTVQEDNAEHSKDGWVIRGNKIKVGNQVELESEKYRVQGVVVDIHKPGETDNATRIKELEAESAKKAVKP
jgi:hypothetical protein